MKRLFSNMSLSVVLGRLKRIDSHRVLSLVMALAMLIPMIPSNIFAIFAVGTDMDAANQNFGADIGNTAEFAGYITPVSDAPETVSNPLGTECEQLSVEEQAGLLVVIVDCYYNQANYALWYKVEAAPGYTAPEKLVQNPWVFQDYIENPMGASLIIHKSGANFVFDAEGTPIDPEEGLPLPQYEKVLIRAESTLQGSVSYQWQICYDREKDLWVDIYYEKSDGLNLSYGMVASLLDENNTVYVRCKSTSGSKEAFCSAIPVTMVPYTGNIIENEFTTTDGNRVSVSVQGQLPKDSALDLKEADATDVNLPAGDQFLLALDISIKNADGKQWQPAPGESVLVELPAAALNLSAGDYYAVYHLHNGQIQALGPYLCDGETVRFEVDGFSKFVFSKIAPSAVSTDDYLSDIGKHAVLNAAYDYLWVSGDPFAIAEYTGTWFKTATIGSEEIVFEIVDVYVSEVAPYALWYKVAAAPGYTLPDMIAQNPWVYQDYTAEGWTGIGSLDLFEQGPAEPACNVTLNGQPVTQLDLPAGEKITIVASTNLSGDAITYQWQILLQSADMWVQIYNQNRPELELSGAVVNSMAVDGVAFIRCVTSNGMETVESDAITVNLVDNYSDVLENYQVRLPRAGEDVKYTVEYKYIFDNGETAWQSTVYEVIAGNDLNQPLTLPKIQGYLPYDDQNKQLGEQIQVHHEDVTADITVVITYKPANVNYTVIHYWQNIHDDGYFEHERVKLEALTNSTVGNVAKDYNGFYALLYERPQVAADGSTIVQIYYDRNYYLMNFNTNGGYGVEPMYARYETPIPYPVPTRPGWNFGGWEPEIPATVPAENREFSAQWHVEGEQEYTIVYWIADLDDGNGSTPATYSYFGSKEMRENPGTVLIPSEVGLRNPAIRDVIYPDFKEGDLDETPYFAYDEAATIANNPATVVVEGDGSTVVNVYYSRKIFEIRFLYARRRDNNSNYQIATDTKDGKLTSWTAQNVSRIPTLIEGVGFIAQTEQIGDYTYRYISLRAEYGAVIEDQWPSSVLNRANFNNTYYYFGSWGAEDGTGYRKNDEAHANIVGPYPYMSADMIKTGNENIEQNDPDTGEIYYVAQRMSAWWGGSTANISDHTYHIFYEVLEGETVESGTEVRRYNGKEYKLVATHDFTAAHNTNTRVDPFYYHGYVCVNDTRGKDNSNLNKSTDYQRDSEFYENTNANKEAGRYACPNNSCKYCNCFYYDRLNSTLTFFNHSADEGTFDSAELSYGQLLKEGLPQNAVAPLYKPSYPKVLEQDAYDFTGWYTTPECYEGTEVDWNSDTMPAGNLTLYAGWKAKTRTVNVYLDDSYNQLLAGPILVTHGQKVPEAQIPETPVHPDGLEFVYWFYKNDEGEEVAFDFRNMPVNQDLIIYAKWSSNVLVTYEFHFENENGTPIADPVTGSGLVGSTKTQDAKGGTDLYSGYQEGWFPDAKNHSITLDVDAENNVHTFVYKAVASVPYTVHYYLEGTTEPVSNLVSKVVNDNKKAVVVENFIPVSGYIPDAVSKQLVVTSEGENEIIFYYSENTKQSYYKVTYYVQNVEGGGYSQYDFEQFLVDNGTTVTAVPINIEGFTYVPGHSSEVKSGVVKQGELLELKLYYDRKTYPYVIKWVDKVTRKELKDTVTGNAVFGATISAQGSDIPGYTLVSQQLQSMVIQIEAGENALLNVITFEYEENQITVNYKVVGGGSVSSKNETVKVINGTLSGSTPKANENYKFVGWYKDQACSQPVDASWVDTNGKLIPRKNGNMYEEATYYAKFEYQITSLTIQKQGIRDEDAHKTFLFHITGEGVDLYVTVKGNDSVTVNGLKVGYTYTVTEITDWSWEYEFKTVINAQGSSAKVTPVNGQPAAQVILSNETNHIIFTNDFSDSDWLGGEGSQDNKFENP